MTVDRDKWCTQGGVHFTEGGYGRIAVKLFNTLDVDTFYVCITASVIDLENIYRC
jgi:hypothetical protein